MVANSTFMGSSWRTADEGTQKRVKDIMADLTFSADGLRELAAEALEDGDFEGARALADNASDTEAETNQ